MVRDFAYNPKVRTQYIVKYNRNGLWFTQFFKDPMMAARFRQIMRNRAGVTAVSRVGVLES